VVVRSAGTTLPNLRFY